MEAKQHFLTLARYNAWANTRLYDSISKLSADEFSVARPAYFGSIMGTLNHGLVADIIWLDRLSGAPTKGLSLDHLLHTAFEPLHAARRDQDITFAAFLADADPAWLDEGILSYNRVDGTAMKTPVTTVLTHVINHATHHRGQVHSMLSQTEEPPPPLDLVYFDLDERERLTGAA